MQALFLVQADKGGLRDLSSYARKLPSLPERIFFADGKPYYDLGGDTNIKWQTDLRLPVDSKKMTIEGWLIRPLSSEIEHLFGGLAQSSYNHGFYIGFREVGFLFSTGNGVRDSSAYLTVDVGVPTHFAWVMDGINKSLFVNGSLVGSAVMSNGLTMPEAITFGYATNTNGEVGTLFRSNVKIHQLIVWDGVKYTGEFVPKYIEYEQQDFYENKPLQQGLIVPADYNGVIADKVLINGVEAMRQVSLYNRGTKELISTVWSDIFGNYRFDNLRPNTEYFVLAVDYARNYNAVIQDMIRTK